MMKKSYIFFALILSNLLGQSFTGLVKDISGEPIPYVIIEEVNSNVDEKIGQLQISMAYLQSMLQILHSYLLKELDSKRLRV